MANKNGRRLSDIRADKRAEAEARLAARAGRSIAQQLELLRQRSGDSKRETARLVKLLAEAESNLLKASVTANLAEAGVPAKEIGMVVAPPKTHKKAKDRKAAEKKHRPGHQE